MAIEGDKAMTISVGDRIPSVTFKVMGDEGPMDVSSAELCGGKKVALFGLPVFPSIGSMRRLSPHWPPRTSNFFLWSPTHIWLSYSFETFASTTTESAGTRGMWIRFLPWLCINERISAL